MVFSKLNVWCGLKKEYYYLGVEHGFYCLYDGFGDEEGKVIRSLPLCDYYQARFSEEGWAEVKKAFGRHRNRMITQVRLLESLK